VKRREKADVPTLNVLDLRLLCDTIIKSILRSWQETDYAVYCNGFHWLFLSGIHFSS
jgi:hypothetical protein